MKWIAHFNKNTKDNVTGTKRLLIVDGHGSHHTKQFIGYCLENDIIPFGLPPHMTHLLQPLDVVVFQPLKHYYSKALDVMVRDGLVNITKREFLSMIEDVRRQAFKLSTIISAFKKSGIVPYNPQPILDELQKRAAERTPTPPPVAASHPLSSPFHTPLTVRQINKIANNLEEALDEMFDDDSSFAADVKRFCKGARSVTNELLQVKRDLGRTEYAKQQAQLRKANKNSVLQSGGVLTIEEGRELVRQKEVNKEADARRLVEVADKKFRIKRKRHFEAAAKLAREWYMTGRLPRACIYERDLPVRELKRF